MYKDYDIKLSVHQFSNLKTIIIITILLYVPSMKNIAYPILMVQPNEPLH